MKMTLILSLVFLDMPLWMCYVRNEDYQMKLDVIHDCQRNKMSIRSMVEINHMSQSIWKVKILMLFLKMIHLTSFRIMTTNHNPKYKGKQRNNQLYVIIGAEK